MIPSRWFESDSEKKPKHEIQSQGKNKAKDGVKSREPYFVMALKSERVPNFIFTLKIYLGFPGGSDGKEYAWIAEDPGSIPGWEDSLEKGIATHSSILAWRITRTEEPDRLQSMRSQRVGHDNDFH